MASKMVQLVDADIQTREVLSWQGIHLCHFPSSSCSQKTRIVLDLKGVSWESHIINLRKKEQNAAWYLGINPRGLVPILIHDGTVHIESNDILKYLEEQFPDPRLVPEGRETEMFQQLENENDLHHDLRNLSMRYLQPAATAGKTPEVLANYRSLGSGTVGGQADKKREIEIDYWERFSANGGITDETVRQSAQRFRNTLDELEEILEKRDFLFDDTLTLLDVAWFIYVNRLRLVSYPIDKLHPRVDAWLERLKIQPAFAKEAVVPDQVQTELAERRVRESNEGRSLSQVADVEI
ncbi:MAG: glutathione S-transferase family protein [Candidatus Rariloculaceae bacterium]